MQRGDLGAGGSPGRRQTHGADSAGGVTNCQVPSHLLHEGELRQMQGERRVGFASTIFLWAVFVILLPDRGGHLLHIWNRTPHIEM